MPRPPGRRSRDTSAFSRTRWWRRLCRHSRRSCACENGNTRNSIGSIQGWRAPLGDSASGEWLGKEVFYQAPLYPYLLAVVFVVFGHGLMTSRSGDARIASIPNMSMRKTTWARCCPWPATTARRLSTLRLPSSWTQPIPRSGQITNAPSRRPRRVENSEPGAFVYLPGRVAEGCRPAGLGLSSKSAIRAGDPRARCQHSMLERATASVGILPCEDPRDFPGKFCRDRLATMRARPSL